MMLSRKKNQFVRRLTDIASTINERFFSAKYKVQIFFSGRDEDFVTLEFKDDKILIEIAIQINNRYVIEGHEKVTYKVFTIDGSKSKLFTEESWTLSEEPNGNKIRETLRQLILS